MAEPECGHGECGFTCERKLIARDEVLAFQRIIQLEQQIMRERDEAVAKLKAKQERIAEQSAIIAEMRTELDRRGDRLAEVERQRWRDEDEQRDFRRENPHWAADARQVINTFECATHGTAAFLDNKGCCPEAKWKRWDLRCEVPWCVLPKGHDPTTHVTEWLKVPPPSPAIEKLAEQMMRDAYEGMGIGPMALRPDPFVPAVVAVSQKCKGPCPICDGALLLTPEEARRAFAAREQMSLEQHTRERAQPSAVAAVPAIARRPRVTYSEED